MSTPASAIDSGSVSVTISAARTLPSSTNRTQRHEHGADQHGAADAAERRLDQLRLVVDDAQLHALRQVSRSSAIAARMPAATCDRVGAELLDDPAADDLAGEPVRDAAAHRRRLAHVGDVAEQHRRAAAHRDDRLAQLLDGRRAAQRAHRPLHLPLRHEAAGRVDVRAPRRVHDLVERDAARRHALRIELDLELAQVAAEPLDRGDAGHGEQPVLDLELREVAQRHQVGGAGLGLERELEDLVEPAGEAGEQRRARCPAGARPAATRSATNWRER